MDIIEISEENIDSFLPLLGEDLSEDVKRVYYNGIGVLDDDGTAEGVFVYELFDSESEEDTRSRICLVRSVSDAVFDVMDEYYRQNLVEDDEIAESFYELSAGEDAEALVRTGFSMEKKEDDAITVTLGDLSETAIGKKQKIPDYIGNIEDISILQFRKAIKDILFKGHSGIMEDIPYLPKNWFDNGVSVCVSSGDRVTGLFLVRRTSSGILVPALLFAYGPDSQHNLLYMLRYSLQQALKLYPPETNVRISRKDNSTRALTDKLLPGRTGVEIYFGTRKES